MAQTALVNVLARSGAPRVATAPAHHDEELSLQRRARRWLGTTAITWPIWALTGAPTGLPQGTRDHHHLVISLGIWPAYLMIGGIADIARKARHLYIDPIEQRGDDDRAG